MLALDGLRGVAALCVAVYHYQEFFFHRKFFSWAWICVDLFFLISGVVMTHVYEKKIEEHAISFATFLSHRVARLWPVHVFALLLALEVDTVLHFMIGQDHVMDWKAPLYTLLLNLVFLQHIGLYSVPTWDGNAWSLTPEIVANLVWFYLLARGKLSSKLLITAVLCLGIVQYNVAGTLDGLVLSSFLVRCGISYAIGCLLYRHFIANRELAPPSPLWCNVSAFALVGLIFMIIVNVDLAHLRLFGDWDWLLVYFVFPALTYLALQPRTLLNALLSSRLFVFFGSISYSVYLLHVQVAELMRGLCTYCHHSLHAPFEGLVYLALTIGLATLTWILLEMPARRYLRDRLAPWLGKIFFDRY